MRPRSRSRRPRGSQGAGSDSTGSSVSSQADDAVAEARVVHRAAAERAVHDGVADRGVHEAPVGLDRRPRPAPDASEVRWARGRCRSGRRRCASRDRRRWIPPSAGPLAVGWSQYDATGTSSRSPTIRRPPQTDSACVLSMSWSGQPTGSLRSLGREPGARRRRRSRRGDRAARRSRRGGDPHRLRIRCPPRRCRRFASRARAPWRRRSRRRSRPRSPRRAPSDFTPSMTTPSASSGEASTVARRAFWRQRIPSVGAVAGVSFSAATWFVSCASPP